MADLINQEAEVQPLRITAGDDFVYTGLIKVDGSPVDISAWDIVSQIRDRETFDLIDTLTIGSGITLLAQSGGTLGKYVCVVPASVTEELRTRKCLMFDIETTNSDGYKRTFLKVLLTAAQDVTR